MTIGKPKKSSNIFEKINQKLGLLEWSRKTGSKSNRFSETEICRKKLLKMEGFQSTRKRNGLKMARGEKTETVRR